jgi:hypothetical protein
MSNDLIVNSPFAPRHPGLLEADYRKNVPQSIRALRGAPGVPKN